MSDDERRREHARVFVARAEAALRLAEVWLEILDRRPIRWLPGTAKRRSFYRRQADNALAVLSFWRPVLEEEET